MQLSHTVFQFIQFI